MTEEYKVLSEKFSKYEVSNLGNVRCKKPDGTYKRVCFSYGQYHKKRQKRFYAVCDDLDEDDVFFYVAETVWRLFGDEPIGKFETVVFKDGDAENCSIDNLKLYKGDTKAMYASHCTLAGNAVRIYQKDSNGNIIPSSIHEFGSYTEASQFLLVSVKTVSNHCDSGKEILSCRGNIVLGRYYIESVSR